MKSSGGRFGLKKSQHLHQAWRLPTRVTGGHLNGTSTATQGAEKPFKLAKGKHLWEAETHSSLLHSSECIHGLSGQLTISHSLLFSSWTPGKEAERTQGLVELCWKDSTGASCEIQTTSLHLHHNNDITQWHILVFKPKYLLIFSYLG